MKQIMVTGGFGFIGSHLVEALLKDHKNRVYVVDDLSTSPIDVASYVKRLRGIEVSTRLTHHICTIQDYFGHSVPPKFDEVYHLASIVGPVGVLGYGGVILRNMVSDTYSLINYCLMHKAKLLDVSTSEVYGGGRGGCCSETDSMIVPAKASIRLEYAVSKLACEVALVNTACCKTNLRATIVRPFNVAGPRQSALGGFVLPRFIQQALAGEALTVYGEGESIRAFTDVREIADGIIKAMKYGHSGEAYNLGNPANKISILDLAKRVIELTNSKSSVAFVDPKVLWGSLFEEASDKYPDASRAMRELDWQPKIGLKEIILSSKEYIESGRRD